MKILRNVSWMTIGMVIGVGAGIAAAATSGTPADVPINAGLGLGELALGAMVGGGGVMHFGHQMMLHHEYAKNVTYGAGAAVGGIAIYQYPAWAPHFGLPAAALIHLLPHALRLIA